MYTLIPFADRIANFSKIAWIGRKWQYYIILTRLIFSILIKCYRLIMIDYRLNLFMLFLDIASCITINHMYSIKYLYKYLTNGCITLESNCNLDVYIIFNFIILSFNSFLNYSFKFGVCLRSNSYNFSI